MCWLASHGRKPGKQDLATFSIPEAARLIQEPEVALSLRTQAYLTSGLIFILNLKTVHLLQDATAARSEVEKFGINGAVVQRRRPQQRTKKAATPADDQIHVRHANLTLRDDSIPWMHAGLDLVGAIEEGAFILHGVAGSEPALLLEGFNLSSSAGGTTHMHETGSGALVSSPQFGVLRDTLADDIMTGSLPQGGLRAAPEYEDGLAADGHPFAFPPLGGAARHSGSNAADPTADPAHPPPPSPRSGSEPRFEAMIDLDGVPLLDDLPPMRLPRRDRSATLSCATAATSTSGGSGDTSSTRSHSALTPALGSHSQASPDTDTESGPQHPFVLPGAQRAGAGGGGMHAHAVPGGPGEGGAGGFGFGDWGGLTQGGGVVSPGSQDTGGLGAGAGPLEQLPHNAAGPANAAAAAGARPQALRAPRPRRAAPRKQRLFRDVDRITIPSDEFRAQITNPQNTASLPPLVAAAEEAQRMPEAVDGDSLDMALAWRRLPDWEHLPRQARAFVLSRGPLFDHLLVDAIDGSPRSTHTAALSEEAPSVANPSPAAPSATGFPDDPHTHHAPFATSPGFPDRPDFDAALTARPARSAVLADPADLNLPEPEGGALAGLFQGDWREEARLAQQLRTGARPFAGGASSGSGSGRLDLELRGLESREFSVEELRALSSSRGGSSGLGTPAIERLRALVGSGSLVDARGNTVSAAQIWGKRGRHAHSLTGEGSDDSQPGTGESPPLLGPIRLLPTLREGAEELQDSFMHDAPLGAPSPPPLDGVLVLPSPPDLPNAPDSAPPSRGPSSEPQGFGTEEFLTQRAPMRPSQVMTEQTTAVHAWLQEEQERQASKRRRLVGNGAQHAQHAQRDVSLHTGTAGLSRADAAKAFYQVLVLQSCRLVEMRQAEPWGDISVSLS
eukprot:jgi/Ulvmu1/849/UM010_0223.1